MVNKLRNLLWMVLFFTSFAHAGAWVQKRGEGLNIFGWQRYLSDQYWTPSGRLKSSPMYGKNYWSNYMEFGITDKLTLGSYITALESRQVPLGVNGGMNDLLFLGRYLIYDHDSTVMSIQLMVDKLGHGALFNIPPQNSQFNSGQAFLIGTSGQFKSMRLPEYWFADASFGFLQRYKAGNQFQINLEAGYKTNEGKVWFFIQEYNTIDIDNVNHPRDANYTLMTIAPSVIYWPWRMLGLQFGMTQDLYGKNVGKGRSLFLANWLTF